MKKTSRGMDNTCAMKRGESIHTLRERDFRHSTCPPPFPLWLLIIDRSNWMGEGVITWQERFIEEIEFQRSITWHPLTHRHTHTLTFKLGGRILFSFFFKKGKIKTKSRFYRKFIAIYFSILVNLLFFYSVIMRIPCHEFTFFSIGKIDLRNICNSFTYADWYLLTLLILSVVLDQKIKWDIEFICSGKFFLGSEHFFFGSKYFCRLSHKWFPQFVFCLLRLWIQNNREE